MTTLNILGDIICLLPFRFPDLQVLALRWFTYEEMDAISSISQASECVISRLPNLDTILLHDVPWSASVVIHLAYAAKLKRLVLLRTNAEDLGDPPWRGRVLSVARRDLAAIFSQLKSFEAEMDLVEAIPFLHALADDHSLDHLSPTVQGLEEADVNSGLATLVGAIGRHRGLICLCIAAKVDEEPQKDILESLGACTCLETLEITIIALFLRIGDNEVGNVLGNMGRLKKLKPDLSTGSMFPLTPQSLVFAVQSCPDLEDATFVVNAMNVIPEAAISFPWIHKKLRNLCMADCNFYPDKISEISSPKAVAAFISQITECEITFSKIKHGDDQAISAGLWEEVADLVPWFQRVRRIVIMSQAGIRG